MYNKVIWDRNIFLWFTSEGRGASAGLVCVAHPGQVRTGDLVRRLHLLARGNPENIIPLEMQLLVNPCTISTKARKAVSPQTNQTRSLHQSFPVDQPGEKTRKCLTSDSPRHIEVRRRRERTPHRSLSHFFVLRFRFADYLRVDFTLWLFREKSEVLCLVHNENPENNEIYQVRYPQRA